MISPGRFLQAFKRSPLPRIAGWSWPFWNETAQPVPIHVLTGEKDW